MRQDVMNAVCKVGGSRRLNMLPQPGMLACDPDNPKTATNQSMRSSNTIARTNDGGPERYLSQKRHGPKT